MPGTTGWTDSSAYDAEKGTWNGYPLKKIGTDAGNGANGMNSAVSAVYLQEISPNGVCVTALKTATLKFNTAVRPGSGMISVYSAGDKQNPVYSVSAQDSSVSCTGQTVKIDFSKAGIFEDGEYFIKIDPASFQSENGRYFYGLADETAWTLDIQRYIPASDIDLKWEKKGIWPFRRDDYSKPPIPAGTDRQYAQALVNWAQSVGITWMSVDEAERLLDKPAYLPVTDRYGSTVLLNDGGTTVRQVIKDIVFAENLISLYCSLSPQTVELTKKLVIFHAAFSIILWPAAFVLPNALRAANDVRFTMFVGIGSMIAFRILGSWILCVKMEWGAMGVWIAMIVDWICRIVFFLIRYRSGKWKKLAGLPT